jgi:hypothetical protein
MLYKIFAIGMSIFVIWQLFVYLRANPAALSKQNMSRSVFTLGVLALLLIGFVAVLVMLVRNT